MFAILSSQTLKDFNVFIEAPCIFTCDSDSELFTCSCTSVKEKAVYRVNIMPISRSGDFSKGYIEAFFESYLLEVKNSKPSKVSIRNVRGIKSVYFEVNNSDYGIFSKQVMIPHNGYAYTLVYTSYAPTNEIDYFENFVDSFKHLE